MGPDPWRVEVREVQGQAAREAEPAADRLHPEGRRGDDDSPELHVSDDLAMIAYEAYRKTAGGPPYHQLTPEQRIAWKDVISVLHDAFLEHADECRYCK